MGNGKVYATVVLIRLIYAGMHILTKASFNEGTSTTVFVFYRHAVAAIFLLPFAFLEVRYPFDGPTLQSCMRVLAASNHERQNCSSGVLRLQEATGATSELEALCQDLCSRLLRVYMFVRYICALAEETSANFLFLSLKHHAVCALLLRMAGTINLYCIGLKYASATSSSAIFNIVPVVAFILAVMFRSQNLIRTKEPVIAFPSDNCAVSVPTDN
jgi:drug/metabolite transporter (DMT)-like permease